MPRTAPDVPPPIDWRRARRLYDRLGTFAAVAQEIECSPNTVSRRLRAQGVLPAPQLSRDPATRGIYASWRRMIRACDDPAHQAFAKHGEQGIRVCASWRSYGRFRDWSLHSGWRPGLGLIRANSSRNFCPSNCQWAERGEVLRRRELEPRRGMKAEEAIETPVWQLERDEE